MAAQTVPCNMTYPHEVTAVSILIFLHNHKPDYLLTGLYYYLHDKQLTDQKAVDSSGSYKARMCGVVYIVAVSTNHYGGPSRLRCLLITMEVHPESESAN